jgi:ATP-dependent Clp protease ATP-binding subunit ClpA
MAQAFGMYVHAIMERGAGEAQAAGSATIEAEHLLLAIAAEQEIATQQLLSSVGLDHGTIRNALDEEFKHSLGTAGVSVAERVLPRPHKTGKRPSKVGESVKLVLERGMAAVGDKKDLRPAHLLLGVLQLKVGTVPRALALAGVDQADLRARTRQSLPNGGK